MSIENNIPLARQLVDLFYPMVEMTLFDAEGSLQEILNPLSTFEEDHACDAKNFQRKLPFQELLVGGRNVRCLIYPLHKDQELVGYLRLRILWLR